MYTPFKVNDVIQFTEAHKWCGCLGIIEEIKEYENDIRYLIGVPNPTNDDSSSIAYIFERESERRFEYIGKAVMTINNEN